MHKYLLIPDSFKGTLSAREVCQLTAEVIRQREPDAAIHMVPVADGGEGTVDAFLSALGGRRVDCPCQGPYGETVPGFYGLLPDGTAVIEMAAAAGLPLAGARREPEAASTFGVGQLLRHAAHHGARRLVLGLGGSATNDGGCGAAAALGVRFFDRTGHKFVPVGGTLRNIARIDASGLDAAFAALPLTAMCDIDNPLCGPQGAAAVFGPQKGADPAAVERLDAGLRHLAACLRTQLGREVLALPGGGAAGGFGAGACALLGARLQPGIDTVLELVDFDHLAADAFLVITGEGRLDSQSLRGKAVIGVARRAAALGVPAAALVGTLDPDVLPAAQAAGLRYVIPTLPAPLPPEQLRLRCRDTLRDAARRLLEQVLGG